MNPFRVAPLLFALALVIGTAGFVESSGGQSTFSVADTRVVEGDSGLTNLVFEITLSAPLDFETRISYLTTDFTAESGPAALHPDYIPTSGELVFAPGETNHTVTVFVIGDDFDEHDEGIVLVLRNPGTLEVERDFALGTIVNDDPHELSVSVPSIYEGDSEATNLVFTLELSIPDARTVTIDFEIVDGTAEGGSDYQPIAGTLTFLPNEAVQTIVVPVFGDTATEADENLFLRLSNPVNVRLAETEFSGVILDDDKPALTLSDAEATEPGSGTSPIDFLLQLSHPSTLELSVAFATVALSAEDGSDYVGKNGVVLFPPGVTNQHLLIEVRSDAVLESNETFQIRLSSPQGMTLANDTATGTILDTSPAPSVSILPVRVVEGDDGLTSATFSAVLSFPTLRAAGFSFSTADRSAREGFDYVATNGTVRFSPGTLSNTFVVAVLGDRFFEGDEMVAVNLFDPEGINLSTNLTTLTIVDDDPVPDVLIEPAVVTEGDFGTVVLSFVVNLSAASEVSASVSFVTIADTADSASDFVATNGILAFPPGVTSGVISLLIQGDLEAEIDETFDVLLYDPVNLNVPNAFATVTILDNDEPCLSIDNVSIPEAGPGTAAVFRISLSIPSAKTVSLNFISTNGTAIGGTDYDETGGTVLIPPGVTSTNISVTVLSNTPEETNEFFYVVLSNPTNAFLCDPIGVGTILHRPEVTNNLTATPLTNQVRCLCEPLLFTTRVDGCGPVSFVWKREGAVLVGETSSNLFLPSLRMADAGRYSVEISGPCGSLTNRAVLTIEGNGLTNPITFSNATPILFRDANTAVPYPSALNVKCIPGVIKAVSVTLQGFTHSFPSDADILLVNPERRSLKLLSDAGDYSSATNLDLTFRDDAATTAPNSASLQSGAYRPTDYEPDPFFPAPAPTGAPLTNLMGFAGSNGNGTWSLFVVDDSPQDVGEIARGWSLTLLWEDAPPALQIISLHDGTLVLLMRSLPYQGHVVESSPDLEHWSTVRLLYPETATSTIILPDTLQTSHLFFRAVRCP